MSDVLKMLAQASAAPEAETEMAAPAGAVAEAEPHLPEYDGEAEEATTSAPALPPGPAPGPAAAIMPHGALRAEMPAGVKAMPQMNVAPRKPSLSAQGASMANNKPFRVKPGQLDIMQLMPFVSPEAAASINMAVYAPDKPNRVPFTSGVELRISRESIGYVKGETKKPDIDALKLMLAGAVAHGWTQINLFGADQDVLGELYGMAAAAGLTIVMPQPTPELEASATRWKAKADEVSFITRMIPDMVIAPAAHESDAQTAPPAMKL